MTLPKQTLPLRRDLDFTCTNFCGGRDLDCMYLKSVICMLGLVDEVVPSRQGAHRALNVSCRAVDVGGTWLNIVNFCLVFRNPKVNQNVDF